MIRRKTHYFDISDSVPGRALCGRLSDKVTNNTRHVTCAICRNRIEDFNIPETPVNMVTRYNLMTGMPYQEEEDTPTILSPASETYWCA